MILKYKSQYNTEKEIKNQLRKYYSGFDEEGLDEAAEAIADLARTERDIQSAKIQAGRGSDIGRKTGTGIRSETTAPSQKPYETIGLSFSRDLIDTGKVNLTGHRINSTEDLAVITQVFRDPRFETLRIIYTKGNQIVGTDAISSRLPNASASFIGDPNKYLMKTKIRMKRLGADEYYLLHNHPSGNPEPSQADISVSGFYAQKLPGFKGHIVINSGKYSLVSPMYQEGQILLKTKENLPLNLGEDRLLKPSIEHPLLGHKVTNPGELAALAKAVQDNDNIIVAFFADNKLRVRGIQEINKKMLNDKNFGNFLRNQAREHGGAFSLIVGDSSVENELKKLVANGFLTDAYIKDTRRALRETIPFKQQGDWMGLSARQEGRALRPPKPHEDTTYRIPEFKPAEKPPVQLLMLPEPVNFELQGEPLRFKTKIPRPFERPGQAGIRPPGEERPLFFKKTIEVPRKTDVTAKPAETVKVESFEIKKGADPVAKSAEIRTKDVKDAALRDISGFQGYSTDVYRIFRHVFGDQFDEVKRAVLDPFDAAKEAHADMQKDWLIRLKTEVVDKLGIRKGSEKSKLVQKFGEGNISLEKLKKVRPNDWQDIVEADKWFRSAYDELLDRVNQVRMKIYPNNPEKIIPRRKNYYRHFREIADTVEGIKNLFDTPAAIDPSLEGISPYTKPKTRWASFMQRRGLGPYKEDAVGGFLDYIPAASYAVNIDPQIGVFRNLAKELAENTEPGQLNNFIRFLNNFANDLAGKTNPADRFLQEAFPDIGIGRFKISGRTAFRALNALNSRIKANVVLGNIGSALSQVGNVPQGIAYAKQYSIPGMVRTVRSLLSEDAPVKNSAFIKERFLNRLYRQFDDKLIQQPRNLAVWLMETADRIGTEFIWNSVYEKALAEGIQNPMKYADDVTRRMVAGRGIGEVPLLQKARITQLIMPFTLEVGNLWHVQKDFIKDKDFAGLLGLYLAAYLFNRGMERVRGHGVLFDPLQAVIDAFGDDEKTAVEKAGRLAGEIFSNVPLGQVVASAYPEYGFSLYGFQMPTRSEFFGEEDPTRFGTGIFGVLSKGVQDPLLKILPPFGGLQAEKTYKGIRDYMRGGSYLGDEDEQLRYPIEQTAANAVRTALFGPSSVPEARRYYDEEYRPLSESQTREVEALAKRGYSKNVVYEMVQKRRELNRIRDQISEVAKDRALTVEQKRAKIAELRKRANAVQNEIIELQRRARQ